MKIAYVLGRYWPAIGGAEQHVRGLAREFAPRHEVTVVTRVRENRTDWENALFSASPERTQITHEEGISIVHIGREAQRKWAYRSLRRMISIKGTLLWSLRNKLGADPVRSSPPSPSADIPVRESMKLWSLGLVRTLEPHLAGHDLVHCFHSGSELLDWAALKVARRLRIPFIYSPLSHPTGWTKPIFRMLYREADALTANTESEKSFLVDQGAVACQIEVVGPGVCAEARGNGAQFRAKHGIPADMVLFVGQKFPYKGYTAMLECAPRVWREYPDLRFVFVGPRMPESREIFAQYADKRIVELGAVPDEDLDDSFDAADIFCLPSTQESFGIVYLQAWLRKKPVIAADIPSSREIIEEGKTGFLVSQDPVAISEKIFDLLQDPGLRNRMGDNGRELVLAEYTWDAIARKVEGFYENVTAND